MFKFGKKKKTEARIDHLRKELAEYRDNALYHYFSENYEGYRAAERMAIKTNRKILALRMG